MAKFDARMPSVKRAVTDISETPVPAGASANRRLIALAVITLCAGVGLFGLWTRRGDAPDERQAVQDVAAKPAQPSGGTETIGQLRTFEAGAGREGSVRFSDGGKRVIFAFSSFEYGDPVHLGRVVWDTETGETFDRFDADPGVLRSMAVSPDGDYAVTAGEGDDTRLRLWHLGKGEELRVLSQDTGPVNGLAFSPDGHQLLAGGGALHLFDVKAGTLVRVFPDSGFPGVVAFSPDGKYAVAAYEDAPIRLWEVAAGTEIRKFARPDAAVISIAFSPDGHRILSGGYNGGISLWHVGTGSRVRQLLGHTKAVNAVVFSPNGRRALSGGYDKTVRLWDADTGQQLGLFEGHESTVVSVAFSSDARRALSADYLGTVRLWSLDGTRLTPG
jgi:WD40 repeat protein